jgi:hypothetical protein
MANDRILECVLCSERFSVKDVKEGRYFPSTGVCLGCYDKAKSGNKKLWCFGQFDGQAIECKAECLDRRLCKQVTNRS